MQKNNIIKRTEVDGQILLLGDSLKILPCLNEKFDACITDPPYNISGYDHKKEIGWLKSNDFWKEEKKFNKMDEKWDGFTNKDYEKFIETWLKLICKVVKKNGNIVIFGTYHNIYKIGYLLEKLNKRIVNSIVWYKRNAFPNITQRMFCESTEYMIWAVNNDPSEAKKWTFNYDVLKKINEGKQMRNVWDVTLTPQREKKLGKHPTQKPIKIIERLVLGLTNKEDYILDPFMGSGTLPLVCMLNNRKSLGIDNNENYFNLAVKRLQNFKESDMFQKS
jgi:site-specific DNA-methyltransferase (adenine-specific)